MPLLLLLGIVAVLLLLGVFIFGPWELPGFGQLSQRQVDQAISAAEANSPTIPPGDSDQDGFTDEVERWIHTDAADNCADDTNDAAWPPDFNNDKAVDMTDADMFKPYFGQKVTGEKSKRFDLNADKLINLSDVFLLRQYFNKGCPYYFMSNPRTEGPNVLFNWAPATEAPILFAAIDLTKSGQSDCNSTQAFQSSAFSTTINAGQQTFGWSKGEGGHEYCAALLRWENNAYKALNSNFVRFTFPASLRVNPQSVDVTIQAGQTAKVLDVTSISSNGFSFYGYPTSYGPGINWSISSSGTVPGRTIPVSISVITKVPAGTYTGVGILRDVQGTTRIDIPVKVTVLNSIIIPLAPSEVTATAQSCTLVRISWRDNSNNERGFRIEARRDSENNFGVIGEVQGSADVGYSREYYWNNVPLGARYIFRVGAYNEAGVNYGYFDNYTIPTNCPQPTPSP